MKIKKLVVSLVLSLFFLVTLVGCEREVPKVKEGKFDFSITYEVDGVQETASSVFVCELADIVFALDGWYREWNSYVEDTALANRLESTRGYLLLKSCEDGEIYLDLNLTAEYFMADPSYHPREDNTDELNPPLTPRLFMEYSQTKGEELGEWWSDDATVLASYGVKVISYEYDAPIENSYK